MSQIEDDQEQICIDIKFKIGTIVFVKTDKEQDERIITGLTIRKNLISYGATLNNTENWFYDFELSTEKDIMKKLDL